MAKKVSTFRETQLLGDGAGDLGGGGITVQVHLIHAVPVHVTPAQLQTVNRWEKRWSEHLFHHYIQDHCYYDVIRK